MLSILGLLFALRGGPGPALAPEPAGISVRAEARATAAESELGPAALLEVSRDLSAGPHAPEWPAPSSTPGGAPIFRAHRPEEWVAAAAHQLSLGDRGVARAALQATAWVLAAPVRVDVSPRHVYVTVRFRAF